MNQSHTSEKDSNDIEILYVEKQNNANHSNLQSSLAYHHNNIELTRFTNNNNNTSNVNDLFQLNQLINDIVQQKLQLQHHSCMFIFYLLYLTIHLYFLSKKNNSISIIKISMVSCYIDDKFIIINMLYNNIIIFINTI